MTELLRIHYKTARSLDIPAHLAQGVARESLTAYPGGPSFAAAPAELEARMRRLFLYGIDEMAAR